jgi:uncharacterized protein (TIGR03083 family)
VEEHDYIGSIRRDAGALAEAAEGNLRLRVPACPDWNVADLVWHAGEVHYFWGSIAEGLLQDPNEVLEVDRPPDGELISWFRRQARYLADVLEVADPTEQVWTWAHQRNVAFIRRRMAQETGVHRWDAQSAAGSPAPLDPGFAADGVDEFLDIFMPKFGALREGSETVHLHSTDEAGEWVATVADGKLTVAREHAKGDAAVRATASELLLLLWRRIGPSSLEVMGDEVSLQRFLSRTDLS